MKQIILSVFVLCLFGCNQNDKFSKTENLSDITKTHVTVNNIVIPESSDNREQAANTELQTNSYDTKNVSNNISDRKGHDKASLTALRKQFNDTHDDIFKVWHNQFIPLYDAYQFNNLETNFAADQIIDLNERYSKLQNEIENVSIPKNLAAGEQQKIQDIKDDLLLAISNRSLAIIEFKSMLAGDESSHQALMDIHINNSDRYLDEVSEDNAELSLEKEELVTAK